MPPTRATTLAILTSTLALAACGGDDEKPTAQTQATSPPESTIATPTQPAVVARTAFAKKAVPICQRAVAARERAEDGVKAAAEKAPREALAAVVAAGVERANTARVAATRGLAELEPPQGEAKAVRDWLRGRREVARLQERYSDALQALDRQETKNLARDILKIDTRAQRRARKLGVGPC